MALHQKNFNKKYLLLWFNVKINDTNNNNDDLKINKDDSMKFGVLWIQSSNHRYLLVGHVQSDSIASRIGLCYGDRLGYLNGIIAPDMAKLKKEFKKLHANSSGSPKQLRLGILRKHKDQSIIQKFLALLEKDNENQSKNENNGNDSSKSSDSKSSYKNFKNLELYQDDLVDFKPSDQSTPIRDHCKSIQNIEINQTTYIFDKENYYFVNSTAKKYEKSNNLMKYNSRKTMDKQIKLRRVLREIQI